MTKRKTWILAILSLALIFFCTVLLPFIETIIISFPGILLGKVVLARDELQLSPRAYMSAEFVLNQVELSEIEHAYYLSLHDDVLFWDPQYVGFPRTELNEGEISLLLQLLSSGNLFYRMPNGESYQCISQNPLQEPTLETCREGGQYMDQYLSRKWEAERTRKVGLLQLFLTEGRLVEIRIYPSELGLAFTPLETGGDWWLDGITPSSPLMDELSARTVIPSIAVLWPEMNADQANKRSAQILGKRYLAALDVIHNSSTVRDVFGEIQEIRPAVGNNSYSSWMDSNSIFLTFRIIGVRGEGVVIIHGDECFDLQMVLGGIPVDDRPSICPNSYQ